MNKKWFFILGIVVLALAFGAFFFRERLRPPQAKLEVIQTNVSAAVFINGDQASSGTPYEEYRTPGEITLRLVPNSPDKPLAPWETRLTLAEGVTTIVRREFGETEESSAGEVLSFEKIGGKKAELAVVTIPDASEVKFNGETRGFSPLPISQASPTENHTLTVSHPGYITREITTLRTEPGYKLTVVVYLAEDPEAQAQKAAEASASAQEAEKAPVSYEVEIQETGVGFLRVRADSSTAGEEVARVTPGKRYPFVSESADKEWIQIEYEKDKKGWVSAQYAKKVEVSE